MCCVHTAAAALNGLRGVFPGVKDSGQTPRSPGCSHAVSTSTARRWHFDRREFSRGLEFSQRPSRQHPHWAFSGPQKRTGDSGGKAAREERERSRFPPRHLNSTAPSASVGGGQSLRGLSGVRSPLSRVRCLSASSGYLVEVLNEERAAVLGETLLDLSANLIVSIVEL